MKAKFTIKREHIGDWMICLDPNAICIRNAQWSII